jgi:hypothetical protein
MNKQLILVTNNDRKVPSGLSRYDGLVDKRKGLGTEKEWERQNGFTPHSL